MDYTKCKGHFDHIALTVPVVNPICLKQLKWKVKHICKKCKRVVITKKHRSNKNYRQAASCFHCSAPRASDNINDVDIIEDFEEVSKALANMCQEDIDFLNIKGCHPKSCIMHYFPIISTCARPFLTNKDKSFDDDLTCELSEIIKTNNLVKKFLVSGIKPNAKDLQRLVFCINTYYDNRKKEQAFCFGSCIREDKWHTGEKRLTHQETFMRKESKQGGKNCVRRRCLFEDQSIWNP